MKGQDRQIHKGYFHACCTALAAGVVQSDLYVYTSHVAVLLHAQATFWRQSSLHSRGESVVCLLEACSHKSEIMHHQGKGIDKKQSKMLKG